MKGNLALDPNPEQYRPQGLYGKRVSQASEEAILFATHVLNPPTISHILAIEAPSHGNGRNTMQDLRFMLQTAYSGFTAQELHRSGKTIQMKLL